MATKDYDHCDTCGKPIDDDDDFSWRADMINAALDDAGEDISEALLTMFVGRHLSRYVAEDRKKARRDFLRETDRETMVWVIGGCDS